jgi:tRNA(His) 5'-end guanylyltransferase
MKRLEKLHSPVLMPGVPIVARMDGIGFSKFTKKLSRPYDERLCKIMRLTAEYLGEEFNPVCLYHQSDEITLVWDKPENQKTEFYGGGRVEKIVSHLSAKTTWKFNKLLPEFIPEKVGQQACFDARIWAVPSREEACNAILWRQQDAYRNAVQMAARYYYSHKECFNKNTSDLQEMIFSAGKNFNDYPSFFKGGSLLVRRTVKKKLTADELNNLPEKHNARLNPDLEFERSFWQDLTDLPILSKIHNRVGVLFLNEEAKIGEINDGSMEINFS